MADGEYFLCLERDHKAMDLIRGGITGPHMVYHKEAFLGWRCGIGPIRDDPAEAVLAAANGDRDGISEAVDRMEKKGR